MRVSFMKSENDDNRTENFQQALREREGDGAK